MGVVEKRYGCLFFHHLVRISLPIHQGDLHPSQAGFTGKEIMHLYVIAQVFRIKNVGIYDCQIANSGERGRKSARNVSPRRIRYILLRGDMGLVGK